MSTRKVVISPGYGAGIASWSSDDKGYDAVENKAFVAYVEGGGRDAEEARAILIAEGIITEGEHFCLLGLDQATVVTVTPPYRIDEYDGYESVIEQAQYDGWRH